MNTLPIRALVLLPIFLALAGCGAGAERPSEAYDPDWDADVPLAAGKSDNLADAKPVSFGQRVEGNLDSDQSDAYWIDLQYGDEIRVTLQVLDGDLEPSVSAYLGSQSYLRSQASDSTDSSVSKTYQTAETGRHYLVAKPYRGRGSGDYALLVECLAGRCAGETVIDPLDAISALECVGIARRCALGEMPRYNGAVGPARAQTLLDECLAEATTEAGQPCAAACQVPGAMESCSDVVTDLPVFADQGPACVAELTACVDACAEAGPGSNGHGAWDGTSALCWRHGMSSDCVSYVQTLQVCGGGAGLDSDEACAARCLATQGAWTDNLHQVCEAECGVAADGPRLHVATFNVERLFDTVCDSGECGARDYEPLPTPLEFERRTAELARAFDMLNADLLFLQEIETESSLAAVIEKQERPYPSRAFGETHWDASVDVAVVTRGDIIDVVRHRQRTQLELPDGTTARFARELLEVHVDLEGQLVIAFAAHLKSRVGDDEARRVAEGEKAAELALQAAVDHPDAVVVLAGDFNDVVGGSAIEAVEDAGLQRVAAELGDDASTYEYDGERMALDHIFHAGAGRFVQGTARVQGVPGQGFGGSDHSALRARFSLD